MGMEADLLIPSGGCRIQRKQENKPEINRLEKKVEMAYKKPEIVAKSEAKLSFAAGCPVHHGTCQNVSCSIAYLK